MNVKIIHVKFVLLTYLAFTSGRLIAEATPICAIKTNKNISQVSEINSIMQAKEILDNASPNALIVFDIGETLAVQKNNLLRILRNYRIFNKNDIHLMNNALAKFLKSDFNAKVTILSNMMLNSPLYFVEPEMQTILRSLQERNLKVIAHCSMRGKNFGAIPSIKNWRFNALQKLGIDFSSSFGQEEIPLTTLNNDQADYPPIFYKGIIFGANPNKGKVLLAFLDQVKFVPSEVLYFDDCEKFVKSYAHELKKRNIDYKGFIYKAVLNPTQS